PASSGLSRWAPWPHSSHSFPCRPRSHQKNSIPCFTATPQPRRSPSFAGLTARHQTHMDLLRILLVPFQPASLILVVVFAVLLAICGSAGFYGIFAQLFLQIWVVKYGYVIIEHIADGEREAPVMDTDMLSPFETRPWVQLAIVGAGMMACFAIGGRGAWYLGTPLLLLLPASMAVLGVGEAFYQAVNPLMLWRLVRGLGVYYLLILAAIPLYAGLLYLVDRANAWSVFWHATALFCELSFFSLIGGCLYLRRHHLGLEPRHTPERSAAR